MLRTSPRMEIPLDLTKRKSDMHFFELHAGRDKEKIKNLKLSCLFYSPSSI